MLRTGRYRYTLAGIALLSVLYVLPLTADDDDHERARHALETGEILSLGTIITKLENDHPGPILEVELEREDGRWIYEIKQLQEGGRLVKMELNAATGEVIRIKGKGHKSVSKPKDQN